MGGRWQRRRKFDWRAAAIGIKFREIVRLKARPLRIVGLALFDARGIAAAVAAL
jgi:hypothetical protein